MSLSAGIPIHDPDVVLTDLGLVVLAAYLGWRLWTASAPGSLPRTGVVIMGGLGSAALWGALFHAFFPERTATRAGFIAWMPVAFSILLVAAVLLELGLRILAPRFPALARRALVAMYAAVFLAVVTLVDESFSSIVRFYGPAVLLFLAAALQRAIRSRDAGWSLISASFVVSVVAALLQLARVALHPEYFDHNAVYHVVQGIALLLLYLGFRRAPALV